MLTWMELAVLQPTRGLSKADLDFLLDKDANTIGALLLHLAATEVLYQRITFNGEQFEKLPPDYEAQWGPAMNLGSAGRSSIKGHDVAFYQDTIRDVREKTLTEFAKRDDAWLLAPLKEPGWGGGPINNYCLWFHVCEHISHHAGQIDLVMKRLPSAKPTGLVDRFVSFAPVMPMKSLCVIFHSPSHLSSVNRSEIRALYGGQLA